MRLKFILCRKQYFYLALAILGVCLALVSFVRAQEATADPVPAEPAQYEQKADRVEIKTERQDAHKALLSEKAQNRITNLTSNVETRMRAAIERMNNIIGRLESRIEKLNAQGIDTSEAVKSLEFAKTSLENADKTLLPLGTLVNLTITSETPKDSFVAVRNQFGIVKSSIQEAHANLRQSVALLKEAIRSADVGNGVSDAVQNDNANSQTQESE